MFNVTTQIESSKIIAIKYANEYNGKYFLFLPNILCCLIDNIINDIIVRINLIILFIGANKAIDNIIIAIIIYFKRYSSF